MPPFIFITHDWHRILQRTFHVPDGTHQETRTVTDGEGNSHQETVTVQDYSDVTVMLHFKNGQVSIAVDMYRVP